MHKHGVAKARKAYISGKIDLATFEEAVEDRLTGSSYQHDVRIDGFLRPSATTDSPAPYAYGDEADDE